MTTDGALAPLSKDGSVPLYRQLYRRLRTRVDDGELAPGDAFPTEAALMERYGVSRITVRAALDQLVRDGLIERQRGRGTFVRSDAAAPRSCVTSFTDQMLALGREPSTELLRLEELTAEERAALDLPFAASQDVVVIDRLRSVDGAVAGLVRTYLPSAEVRELERAHFARTGRGQSLLHVLEHVCGIVLEQGEETSQPVALEADVARTLGVAEGSAAILKTCTLADVAGAVLLYEEAYWAVAQTQLVKRYPAGA